MHDNTALITRDHSSKYKKILNNKKSKRRNCGRWPREALYEIIRSRGAVRTEEKPGLCLNITGCISSGSGFQIPIFGVLTSVVVANSFHLQMKP